MNIKNLQLNLKENPKKTLVIAIALILLITTISFSGYVGYNTYKEKNEVKSNFKSVGNLTQNVDNSLADLAIEYIRNDFKTMTLSNLQNSYPNLDIQNTYQKWTCKTNTPAQDDKYLYITMSCGGDAPKAYDQNGVVIEDIPVYGFSNNTIRFEYKKLDNQYVIVGMEETIKGRNDEKQIFPQEYWDLLDK